MGNGLHKPAMKLPLIYDNIHFKLKFQNPSVDDDAYDNAELVQAPVTAELACLIDDDDVVDDDDDDVDSRPDKVIPFINPALSANTIPYSTA